MLESSRSNTGYNESNELGRQPFIPHGQYQLGATGGPQGEITVPGGGEQPENVSPSDTREAADARTNEIAEVPASGRLDSYFNEHIVSPYARDQAGSAEKLARYKEVLSNTAVDLFGEDVFAGEKEKAGQRNSAVRELAGMLTSLDHNAGVYYSEEDVEGIFNAVAHEFFDDTTKQQLRQAESQGIMATNREIDIRAKAVSSVDTETALPLVKDASGVWRVAGPQEYGQDNDFTPLEVLRQDNEDKRGWDKYRFRGPTYSRQPDGLHTKQVADGWFTSEWHREPNYWSAQIRDVVADAAHTLDKQLADIDAKVVFDTKGGVFKGTSTAGTDLDTVCNVVCNSPAEFEHVYQVTCQILDAGVQRIPFKVKEGGISIALYDRSTGKTYHRRDSGEYKAFDNEKFENSRIVKTVQGHEKGVMVTAPERTTLFRKPKELDGKSIRIGIPVDSGEVRQLPDESYRPPLRHNKPAGTISGGDWT